MDDSTLIARLGGLAAPDYDGSRDRAAAALPARVRSARAARTRRRRQLAPRIAAAVIVLCLALASLTIFTAPGRAVSNWVGDQLGFGQPGEHPTLRQIRHKLIYAPAHANESVGAGQAAYVLARGRATLGAYWEFITFRSNKTGAHCYEVEVPKRRMIVSSACEEKESRLASENGLQVDTMSGNGGLRESFMMVVGRISDDVDGVRVRVDGRTVPVEIEEPPASLFEELGFKRTFEVFAAFPTGIEKGGELTVVAVKDGRPVGRVVRSQLMNQRTAAIADCRWAEGLAKEGSLKPFNARRTCVGAGIDPKTMKPLPPR